MRSAGIRVARNRGEEVRRTLAETGRLRADLEIRKEGEYLILPVAPGTTLPGGELVEREFEPVPRGGPADYRDGIDGSPEWAAQLPRSFDVIGDVVLIRLPEELALHRSEIGEALLAFVPSARIVGRDLGVHGPERIRRIERIAGVGGWSTRHRENGIEFDVDVERAYFSPRLAREHARVAEEVQRGDAVLDLCCGVGPFALTIAKGGRAARIVAIDSNPAAIELLSATRARYAFGAAVEPICAPIETFLPAARPAERVVLNLPHEGIKYAPLVVPMVAPRGRLYYYEITPRTEFDQRAASIMNLLGPEGWRVVERHGVHPYSPSSDLVAYVFERTGN